MGFITSRSSARKIAKAREAAWHRGRRVREALMDDLYHFQSASTEAVDAARERAAGVSPDQLALDRPQAFQGWQSGLLRPWRLTIAFNQAGFSGEWVDAALGVPLGVVDVWERGVIYPTWAQLTRIAALTDTNPDELLNAPDRWFKPNFARCASAVWAEDLRRSYSPAVVQATVSTHPGEPTTEAALRGYETAMLELAEPILKHVRTKENSDKTDLELLAMIR